MNELKIIDANKFAKEFIETHNICNWCGQVFETTDSNKRFCSTACEVRYKVAWEASYEERREAFLRDYENWQRIRPVYTIHNDF